MPTINYILYPKMGGQQEMRSLTMSGVLIAQNFGCVSPITFSQFHCNPITEAINVHTTLNNNQQNEHTPHVSFTLYGYPSI